MPRQRELPSELHELARLKAFVLSNDRYDEDPLIDAIQLVLGAGRDVGRAAAVGPSTPLRWLRGARAREGRSVFIWCSGASAPWSLARLVRNDLIEHGFDTFMDAENLHSGESRQKILSQIEAREHFIVLLQPGSLDQIEEGGDWLHREIAHALAHNRNVVPVGCVFLEGRLFRGVPVMRRG